MQDRTETTKMSGRPKSIMLKGYDSFAVRLGDELRGERATLGKSLLDVQRDLRIKAAYIAAIENCDISVFQNKGFIAGYVRSYARYLDLDPDVIFARFCDEAKFGGVNAGMNPKPVPNAPGKPVAAPKNTFKREENTLIHPALKDHSLRQGMLSGISPSAIGSVGVLLLIIGGLGFGAWSVLQEIQRVQLVPVDQTPGAVASVDVILQPDVSATTADPADGVSSDLLYARVYRPQELEVPVVDHRDGPIANIDPSMSGTFSHSPEVTATQIASLVEQAVEEAPLRDPVLVQPDGRPKISVFAASPAWIRVYLPDGSSVFEKILDTGEAYVLPANIQAPMLRAGNSGSVYVSVGSIAYGPIGQGVSVAKEVSLAQADVEKLWPVATEQAELALQALTAANAASAIDTSPVASVMATEISLDLPAADGASQ